jgi:hypothetical protein
MVQELGNGYHNTYATPPTSYTIDFGKTFTKKSKA